MMSHTSRRTLVCPHCLAPVSVVTAHTASYYDPHFAHSCGFKGVLRWSRPVRARHTVSAAKPRHLTAEQYVQPPHRPAPMENTKLPQRGAMAIRAARRDSATAGKPQARIAPDKIAVRPASRANAETAPARSPAAKASLDTSARRGSKLAPVGTARIPASYTPGKQDPKAKGRALQNPAGSQHASTARPAQKKPAAAVLRSKVKVQAASPTPAKPRHRAA